MAIDTPQTNKRNLLRQAVVHCAREVQWELHKAFEQTGCSCQPLRKQLEALDAECNRLRDELESQPVFEQRKRLGLEIAYIDSREHPSLNALVRVAGPFFRVWLFEHLAGENPPDITNPKDLATQYASAWYAGWRPRA